jgi:hypothetical protein
MCGKQLCAAALASGVGISIAFAESPNLSRHRFLRQVHRLSLNLLETSLCDAQSR